MNCRKGDIAIVVRLFPCIDAVRKALERDVLGRVVRCVELGPEHNGMPVWKIGEIIPVDIGFMRVKVEAIEDCLLQPIRGVPVPEKATDDIKEPA
ncbi:hypothetical protein [Paraburkholderia rhynchosiae]|uniref:Uncharacterized protein n=1 Tax=Paraburkholderia rhynchosiae TaxID=487049 RepID=A0A2N7W9C4_9BURK|nr:hypothetical protein [Paraburkholderia rhynchosiae]PMS25979.1 hypothetical protein C0Z16_28000 [Paraburkholderia rhynchosiae]CAB3730757.1 hypothetical protein LMG27174_05776 [Paraburkholderia rhynchosiae]